MNRIDSLFQNKKAQILSVYFTAGYPELEDTMKIIETLDKSGADMIEIGMPFSDPVADGPVIQESSKIALGNGMNLDLLFKQIKTLRQKTQIPVILMGYINPVFRMGMEIFLNKCQHAGIDGLILPDLPAEEYEEHFKSLFEERGINNILLITPQTSDTRILEIDNLSRGFIYVVSNYATTGGQSDFSSNQLSYFRRIKNLNLKNPLMIGFGISDKKKFNTVCEYAAGGIVGTSFIQALNEQGKIEKKVGEFVQKFKEVL
ncbi:MAG: tryptophan synthase subunit alpha [Bacteroidales bacterium]|nr:tryptophan synthase subunit alpha [Bacteroidales bacterium]MCF8389487.1 tryptophan synthase subunit alpha [Bacteroidales bacterium]